MSSSYLPSRLWQVDLNLTTLVENWRYVNCKYDSETSKQLPMLVQLGFLNTIRVSIWRISHFWLQVGMCVWLYFCLWNHLGLFTMQIPLCLRKITLLSIQFRVILTQTVTWMYQESLPLYIQSIFDWCYSFDTHW